MLARPHGARWALVLFGLMIHTALAHAEPTPDPGLRVQVRVDGRTLAVSADPGQTVTDVLNELSVSVGPDDRVKPGPRHEVFDGLCAAVIRVRVGEATDTVDVPYEVQIREDRTLRYGLVRLKAGTWQDGVVQRTIRHYVRDDGVTEEYVVGEAAMTPMHPKTITIGTKGHSPSRASGLPGRYVTLSATAYAPNSPACGSTGHTSIGLPAGRGVVAVDPGVIPYGTKMWIEGYGWAVAGDTGSAIRGHRIDLCFDTYGEAVRYGTRDLKVRLFE